MLLNQQNRGIFIFLSFKNNNFNIIRTVTGAQLFELQNTLFLLPNKTFVSYRLESKREVLATLLPSTSTVMSKIFFMLSNPPFSLQQPGVVFSFSRKFFQTGVRSLHAQHLLKPL
jgi:hypothetical protein